MDRQAVREAIEEAGLVTAEEPILFELLTTFRVIDVLTSLGWQTAPFTLFHGHVHTIGHTTDGRQIDLWYQTTPRTLSDV
jgi:8-oxo-dGTP pyrophosphatase MutT (NUDIX family)